MRCRHPVRFPLWTLLIALVATPLYAQELTLDAALERALARDVEVRAAQADLAAAERELSRIEADPLALHMAVLQAEHALANARAELEAARLAARERMAATYLAALEADDALALARLRLEIAAMTLEAAEVRFAAGAATAFDVERARIERGRAEREALEAERARALAYDELAALLGADAAAIELEEVASVPALPSLDEARAALARHAQLRRAEQAVAVAEARLRAVDHAFSPRAEIEAAKDALALAELRLSEMRGSLELSLQQRHHAFVSALGRVESAQAAFEASERLLAAQTLRFEAGTISRLELLQAELEHASTEAQLRAARHALVAAQLAFARFLLGG